MKDDNAIEAMLAIELPGQATSTPVPPSEIQWAPPGTHTINASRGGKPTTVTIIVDEISAQRVAAAFQGYVTEARQGNGDMPFCDFNHDDQEASAWPTGFFWGGSDPQRGGIRATVNWSDKGKQAVLGRNYRRFSPSFYPDNDGRMSGIPINCGGLVNKAAFQRIAPVMSKRAEAEVLSSPSADFLTKAKALARSRNLDLVDAATVLAQEQPSSYDQYRAHLMGVPVTTGRSSSNGVAAAADLVKKSNDEFIIRARGMADALDIDIGAAYDALAREQPFLYERYRAKLLGLDLDRATVADIQACAVQSPFYVRAKAVAVARGIDVTAALDIVARESPALYDAYRESL
jgi:hypothetical protein